MHYHYTLIPQAWSMYMYMFSDRLHSWYSFYKLNSNLRLLIHFAIGSLRCFLNKVNWKRYLYLLKKQMVYYLFILRQWMYKFDLYTVFFILHLIYNYLIAMSKTNVVTKELWEELQDNPRHPATRLHVRSWVHDIW